MDREDAIHTVLPIREQSRLRDEWLGDRLATVVPIIMQDAGIDCWVLIAREYNEDPVVKTMLPAEWQTARRRTILVFTEYGMTRVSISRYSIDGFFPGSWNPDTVPDQWDRLAEYLTEQNPQRIAINRSALFALADGLTASESDQFMTSLPSHLASRVVATPLPAIGWLEMRTPGERAVYPDVCHRAHDLLRRALSAGVVEPGRTTTRDIEWWLCQQSSDLGYTTWFHPHVSLQRAAESADQVIQFGDLIHIDFGIEYLGLHTDQQQHAYVLRPGEVVPPHALVEGLAKANQLQDFVMAEFRSDVTGNGILKSALERAKRAGIRASIYSHPIGLHGHGAGPTIGLWDRQDGVPGTGDYPVRAHTAYSIELAATVSVPEWGDKDVTIMLEEDAYFDGDDIAFLDGRQEELWLI